MLGIISVGEYLEYFQPEVAAQLWAWAGGRHQKLFDLSFEEWKRLMETPYYKEHD